MKKILVIILVFLLVGGLGALIFNKVTVDKKYTQEDLDKAYQLGYETALPAESEYKSMIKELRQQVEDLQENLILSEQEKATEIANLNAQIETLTKKLKEYENSEILIVNLNDLHQLESFINVYNVNGEYTECYIRIYRGYPNYSYNYGMQFNLVDGVWTFYSGMTEENVTKLESEKFFLSDYTGFWPDEGKIFDRYFTIDFEQIQLIFNKAVDIVANSATSDCLVGELHLSEFVTFYNKDSERIKAPIDLTINVNCQ